jgi:hypothetical protein
MCSVGRRIFKVIQGGGCAKPMKNNTCPPNWEITVDSSLLLEAEQLCSGKFKTHENVQSC